MPAYQDGLENKVAGEKAWLGCVSCKATRLRAVRACPCPAGGGMAYMNLLFTILVNLLAVSWLNFQ